ncbi:hypothetical protein LguiB_019803 [Lonicera macranthoides]
MDQNTNNQLEAERLLGIAEKLLQGKDLNGSKDFAILAQETDPLLDGTDQILAVADVLLAADKRINNHHDWYSILQLHRPSDDLPLIKKHYRRLALLLHPDKNKFPFSDAAFNLVADAWTVLSDSTKKSLYDGELDLLIKADLNKQSNFEPDIADENEEMKFWTACPYCYSLFEYPAVYEGCCLRCQNCQRAFHAAVVPSLPPLVQGKDSYYCCWGFFPMGFKPPDIDRDKKGEFQNWTTAPR